MLLNSINDKLESLGLPVYYGMLSGEEEEWNYIVFGRSKMNGSTDKTSYADYYTVGIIHENYIPEGFDLDVIEKMLEIPGMRLSPGDFQYEYTMKKNTKTVVEVLVLEFYKSKKKV